MGDYKVLNRYVLFLTIASTAAMINQTLISSNVLRYTIYAITVLFIIWIYNFLQRYNVRLQGNKNVFYLLGLLCLNFALSAFSPNYSWLLKYFAYVLCFYFGTLVYNYNIPIKVNKALLLLFIGLPMILVGVIDTTPHKTMFFILSNAYSFTGLAFTLFFYTIFKDHPRIFVYSWILLLMYILSSSTLGILVSVLLSVIFINRHNMRLLIYTFFMGCILIVMVVYSDLQIFKRVRDVILVFQQMTVDDWLNLKDLNVYYLQNEVSLSSDRTDNNSAIWRLTHWAKLLSAYWDKWYYSIWIGLGDNYTNQELGNYPHNDYLRMICEYGFIISFLIISKIKKLFDVIKNDEVFYFVAPYFFYLFTENIIDTFVANALMLTCIGYHYTRCAAGDIKTFTF